MGEHGTAAVSSLCKYLDDVVLSTTTYDLNAVEVPKNPSPLIAHAIKTMSILSSLSVSVSLVKNSSYSVTGYSSSLLSQLTAWFFSLPPFLDTENSGVPAVDYIIVARDLNSYVGEKAVIGAPVSKALVHTIRSNLSSFCAETYTCIVSYIVASSP